MSVRYQGLLAAVGTILALAACSGDGPSTGTIPKDSAGSPDIVSDTTGSVDADTALADADPVDAPDAPDVGLDAADTADVVPGYDIGVELPPAPTGPACSSNADCEAPTGRCDPLYEVCVECVVGTECGWNKECVDYHCTGPGGQRCLYDWDCLDSPDGHTCKPLEMICTECYEDWQCGSDEVCENNACVPGTWQPWCDTTLDCPADKVCNNFHCVECAGREDCADGQWCLNFACVTLPPPDPEPPVANLLACESDKDCRDYDALCNKEGGFCAVEPALCRTDEHCPPEYTCRGNVCRAKRCYPSEGMCFDLARDFSSVLVRAPHLLKCTPDGGRFDSYDDLIACSAPGLATFECNYGAGAYDASCGPWSPDTPDYVCRDAYTLRVPIHSAQRCACNSDVPDHCVHTPTSN